ncbi:metallophosphoesterase [Nocardia callitridis]|uniref:Metallophosphoesterase n=1 Tax=Nocardia callitridis TaxID=648753 RepID=A0ABP9KYD4_9NOCA
MILVAQVSDTHVDSGARNTRRVEEVMAFLSALRPRPDAILLTGDITDHGWTQEYEIARRAVRSDIPVYSIPGNHDDRTAFRTHLLGEPASTAPVDHAHRVGELTVALLDSSVPGEPGGRLTEDTYAWLRTVLAEAPPDKPILLALHHPPVVLHSPVIDEISLDEPQRLAEVIAADERIIGVVAGHAHTSAATTFAGRPLIVAPSTSSVLGGTWELELPDQVMDYAPDPAVALHLIDPDSRFTTHFRTVPMTGRVSVKPE